MVRASGPARRRLTAAIQILFVIAGVAMLVVTTVGARRVGWGNTGYTAFNEGLAVIGRWLWRLLGR
jgi:hypothetical protein